MSKSLEQSDPSIIPWHRRFAIGLADLLSGSDWEVVMELDLSVKQQLLDIVIVRRGEGPPPPQLPNGLGPLADHNLVTYKSLREPLDGWALKELVGHSVNYRKQVSPSLDRLLPEDSFRLFAVATRFPEKLASQIAWQEVGTGMYDVAWGTDTIRVLVLKEVPAEDQNAFWNLFSGERTRIEFGAERYRNRPSDASSLLKLLYSNYQKEGIMPYTTKDFWHDITKAHLNSLTPDERLAGMSPDERLAGMSPDERLAGMSPNERLAGMSPDEVLAAMSPDEMLATMPMEQLREFVRKREQRLAPSQEEKGPRTKPGTKSPKASKRSSH
ncbi:MAG: hypothetical protein ACKV2Q_22920 [Planctomycetaceae bacterium]